MTRHPLHWLTAGELSSDDDFYMLDTGLVVLQTTNDILDASLYRLLTPAALTSWQRVRAANMLSTSGVFSVQHGVQTSLSSAHGSNWTCLICCAIFTGLNILSWHWSVRPIFCPLWCPVAMSLNTRAGHAG